MRLIVYTLFERALALAERFILSNYARKMSRLRLDSVACSSDLTLPKPERMLHQIRKLRLQCRVIRLRSISKGRSQGVIALLARLDAAHDAALALLPRTLHELRRPCDPRRLELGENLRKQLGRRRRASRVVREEKPNEVVAVF